MSEEDGVNIHKRYTESMREEETRRGREKGALALGVRPAECARSDRPQQDGDRFCNTCWRPVPVKHVCPHANFTPDRRLSKRHVGKRVAWRFHYPGGKGGRTES